MNNPFDFFMQQAQKFPDLMNRVKQELTDLEIIGEAGAGLARVVMNGYYLVKDIQVDQSLPPETVRDLLLSAFNVAGRKVADAQKETFSRIMKECGLPEGFSFPFLPSLFQK